MQRFEQSRQGRTGWNTLTRHACIDLNVHGKGGMRQLPLHRFLLQKCELVRLPHHWRQRVLDTGGSLVLPHTTHDKNAAGFRDRAKGLSHSYALFYSGDAEPARAGAGQHRCAFRSAMTVRIGFHYREHVHVSSDCSAETAVIRTQGRGGNLCPDRACVLDRDRTHRFLC